VGIVRVVATNRLGLVPMPELAPELHIAGELASEVAEFQAPPDRLGGQLLQQTSDGLAFGVYTFGIYK
jgi:hypothetical protein